METRSATREVKYLSEIVSETEPVTVITQTNSNFGTISTTQSAHKGCVAKLWKIVYENGAEVSRQEVNKSKYSMAPKYIGVGMANASAAAAAELGQAIASNNEKAVREIISKYGTVKATVDEPVDADTASEAAAPVAATPDQAVVPPAGTAVAPEQPTAAPTPEPAPTPAPEPTAAPPVQSSEPASENQVP